MLKYAVFTDKGGRNINEDSAGVFESENKQCFILCDGLGGHGMGDTASSLVKDAFGEKFSDASDASVFLASAFEFSQKKLLSEQKARNAQTKMKTTAVVLVTDENNAYIGYVGDSRLYIFRKNKVQKRTLDHSVPQMLALSGEIKESQIRNHPDRSLLLRVMGCEWDEPKYQILEPIPLTKCQAFLLCSDGFWELINEKEMSRLLKNCSSPEEWLSLMAEIVKRNGEGRDMDNYTAIAVWNT